MPPVGFEPTISAGERPKAYALDRAATGTGNSHVITESKKKKEALAETPVSKGPLRATVHGSEVMEDLLACHGTSIVSIWLS